MPLPGINLGVVPPQIPKEKRKAKVDVPLVLTLYGPPKVGKTTSLANLDGCLIMNLEPRGTDFVDAWSVDVENIHQFFALLIQLSEAKEKPKYLAVDHLGMLETWCEDWATDVYRHKTIGKDFDGESILELAHGGGYHHLRVHMHLALAAMLDLKIPLIWVVHVRDRFLEKGSKEVLSQDLDLLGKMRNIVCGMSDAIGYMHRAAAKPEDLRVSFLTRENVNCGCRAPNLAGKVITLSSKPSEFHWELIYKQTEKKEEKNESNPSN